MNQYGMLAMRHWQQHTRSRVAAIPDPTEFFTTLGNQIEAQVVELAKNMAAADPLPVTYPETVGRRQMARVQAEEVVLMQLVWIEQPELPLPEAREEWEQTRTSDRWLERWALRIQDTPETLPSTEEIRELADRWAVPVEFLEQLVTAPIPGQFLADNWVTLAEAANIRFIRELQ